MTARITQQLKVLRYSKVFSLVLKTVTAVQVRISTGSEFHSAVRQTRRHAWQQL